MTDITFAATLIGITAVWTLVQMAFDWASAIGNEWECSDEGRDL